MSQLRHADVKAYVQPLIAARVKAGQLALEPTYLPMFEPMMMKGQGPFVVLNVGGGAGLTKEHVFDRPFVGVRVVSRSQDFDGGEALALALDEDLCAFDHSGRLGSLQTSYITRTGGRPQLSDRDNAERYHFTATYITEVETGF